MSLRQKLRIWWQIRSGKDDTPLDDETPFWLISFFFHLAILVVLAMVFVPIPNRNRVTMIAPPVSDVPMQEVMPTIDFNFEVNEEIGAEQFESSDAAMAMAPDFSSEIDVTEETELQLSDFGELQFEDFIAQPVAIELERLPVRGNAGFATVGADGAVDRITQEILRSLEERNTLVVWMFDQSASLVRQRAEILSRFDNIYRELEDVRERGGQQFARRNNDDPLLTQVLAFGQNFGELLPKPTTDIESVKSVVRDIPIDESGVERVFSAVIAVANKYKHFRRVDRRTGERERNVLIIILSDEKGDDEELLDEAVKVCKTNEIPVYVIGVPSPFGVKETFVKYVDPDPQFDQSVQWLPVDQGPESLLPERLRLNFSVRYEEDIPIDSGFGPFSLTRLCYESGGIYFTVHPNRDRGSVGRRETAVYSAHFEKFFDPEIMRRYRPDYVSTKRYLADVQSSKARIALVQAAQESWGTPVSPLRTRFPKLNEAAFVNAVSEAQRPAALMTNQIERLYDILKLGESDRKDEVVLRWKAGYDLAMGSVLAIKIRAEGYNKLLAMLKTRLTFQDPNNNVWLLRPADTILTGSATEKLAEKAKMYLSRVVEEHPNTPWAYLAQKELAVPLGWELAEAYQAPPPPPPVPDPAANNNPAPEREMPREQPLPRRTPKL
ncbi:MAG TPA: VWA domain-containing protein [Pirellulaceae bacterium]|nr:VWA domain-containing protein [Pirellulaceae bacterium]HMO93552.1 VWA domain-containing protein [Pirellulaceae bacterium]HMP70336.1 VWA domain-containing protein [Pirellulaceae bacterium]